MLLLLMTHLLLHKTGVSAQDQRHLGCYKDVTHNRVLSDGIWVNGIKAGHRGIKAGHYDRQKNTPQRCINFCINRNKTLAGVQFGHECFCGVAGDNYERHGRATDGECNKPCPGDEGQKCGGASRMNIYRAECLPGRFSSSPSGYDACRQECHCSNVTAQCDVRTGACPDVSPRCAAGWKGRKCDESCEAGSWGRDCSGKCGKCYGNRICNSSDGSCGEQPEASRCRCAAGFSGEKCTESCAREKFGCDCRNTCHCAPVGECNSADGTCPPGGCNSADGTCPPGGCKQDWHGRTCSRRCPVGRWGSKCEGICHCSASSAEENCDLETGNCEGGCADGFASSGNEGNCQTAIAANGEWTWIVAVAVAAVTVSAFAVFASLRLFMKMSREGKQSKQATQLSSIGPEVPISRSGCRKQNDCEQISATDTTEIVRATQARLPIPLPSAPHSSDETQKIAAAAKKAYTRVRKAKELEKLVLKMSGKSKSNEEWLIDEYQNIAKGYLHPTVEADTISALLKKNRFQNIVPYDYNRIKLPLLEEVPESHYINASLIEGYKERTKYIASQGPTAELIPDFLNMIFSQKSRIIVMLTNFSEGGKNKCDQYWPKKVSEVSTFGPFTVELQQEESFPSSIVLRKLLIKKSNSSIELDVKHFHYLGWPDNGVSENVTPILSLRNRLRGEMNEEDGPPILHCSAGIGRTGTLIGLDYLIDEIDETQNYSVFNCVERLRGARFFMVQTLEQYRLLYIALDEYFAVGDTRIPCNQSDVIYRKLSKDKIHRQFRKLKLYIDGKDIDYYELDPNKVYFNVSPGILPNLAYMVRLPNSQDKFINAISAHTPTQTHQFIITQVPHEQTLDEFWSMIYDWQCKLIVQLNGNESYLPEDDYALECRNLCVTRENRSMTSGSRSVRQIGVCIAPSNGGCNASETGGQVRLQHFMVDSNWSFDEELMKLIEETIHLCMLVQGKGPIVLVSSDGAKRVGEFAALCSLFESAKNYGEVNVFNTIKMLQESRPQLFQTEEQFSFVHSAVARFMEGFNTYSNFK